jgi:hypothetical protein
VISWGVFKLRDEHHTVRQAAAAEEEDNVQLLEPVSTGTARRPALSPCFSVLESA